MTTMKFTVQYPVAHPDADPELTSARGMSRVATQIERLGYDAIAFTEHPAPSREWMQTGGHQSLDAPAALAFCAAVTERVGLMTYLTVVPYHSPFVAAKAMSTVDRLSGGRVAMVAGAGYLKSEFHALGVDYAERGELLDEGLRVMRNVWSGELCTYQGKHFNARDVVSLPTPVQPGGPPIYIGGNSAQSRRRAAEYDGWSPLLLGDAHSQRTSTMGLGDLVQFGDHVREVRDRARQLRGEEATTFIQVQTRNSWAIPGEVNALGVREHIQALRDTGVDSFVVKPVGDGVDAAVAALRDFADVAIGS